MFDDNKHNCVKPQEVCVDILYIASIRHKYVIVGLRTTATNPKSQTKSCLLLSITYSSRGLSQQFEFG